MGAWATFALWAGRAETLVTGGLFAASLLLVMYTIAARYFAPAYAPRYTDEATVYLVMWAVMLALGSVTARREHVHGDLIVHMLAPAIRRRLEIAANITGVLFALFLAYYGGQVALEAWSFNDLSPTNLRFPLWIYYSALPVSAVLMAIGHVRVAVDLARGKLGYDEAQPVID